MNRCIQRPFKPFSNEHAKKCSWRPPRIRARLQSTWRAEKVASRDVLKGHGFSRAVQALSFRPPEWTLVREGSAFPTFSETSSVVPQPLKLRRALAPGFVLRTKTALSP